MGTQRLSLESIYPCLYVRKLKQSILLIKRRRESVRACVRRGPETQVLRARFRDLDGQDLSLLFFHLVRPCVRGWTFRGAFSGAEPASAFSVAEPARPGRTNGRICFFLDFFVGFFSPSFKLTKMKKQN